MSIAEWIDATLVTDRSSAGRRLRDTVAWDLIRTTFGCEIIEKLIKREYDILCRCCCSRSSLQFFIEIRTAQFFPQWSYSNFCARSSIVLFFLLWIYIRTLVCSSHTYCFLCAFVTLGTFCSRCSKILIFKRHGRSSVEYLAEICSANVKWASTSWKWRTEAKTCFVCYLNVKIC